MGRKSIPIHVKYGQFRKLLLSDLLSECGRGTFIQKTNNVKSSDWDYNPCPFCGCQDYIAFIDDEWKGNQSSPDDVFECFVCGATSTRRDAFGNYETVTWDKDKRRLLAQ